MTHTPPDGESSNTEGSKTPGIARRLGNYLIAGLLIWIPIMVTIWVLMFLSRILDQSLLLLPRAWRPDVLLGRYIPGEGIILSLLVLLLTGLILRNLFGRQLVHWLENHVRRIPFLGAVYGGAKTFSETVLTDKGTSFKQVVAIEFPCKGMYSLGFITAHELEELKARTERDVTCVFVAHAPNAYTGFIVLVPREDVIPLDMTIDEAFKMLITVGVVVPRWTKRPVNGRLALPESGP